MRFCTIAFALVVAAHLACTPDRPSRPAERSDDASVLPGEARRPSGSEAAVAGIYNVRDYGARGDGRHIDSPAINLAIADANAHGGGTVVFPAGDYLCFSIRLQNNVELALGPGCTIIAADSDGGQGVAGYDAPELNGADHYQDFGHSHFRNSLIWGDGVENVSITGPGLIWGKGLSDGWNKGVIGESTPSRSNASTQPTTTPTTSPAPIVPDARDSLAPTPRRWEYRPARRNEYPNNRDSLRDGVGNKSLALKNCRNVTLRDFSVLHGGHFAFLLTGCENLTIDNVKLDTNRDGMDIDCCRNVRVSNCSVNSPNDDGICLKSSYGLGLVKSCEDVTITNCYVTGGYREGTLLNGKRERFGVADRAGRIGRIKFGTESNGGFKRITISNCILEYCGGLAIESVDGAIIQDVTINNLVMRDIVFSPIFIRLGNRARGPENPPPGIIRRINISDVVCSNANWRYGSIITGIPGHPIEDLTISNVRIQQQGGGTEAEADFRPMELEAHYPEPSMFGTMPSSGFFLRHVNNVSISDMDVTHFTPDARPLFWLEDVHGADFDHVRSRTTPSEQAFRYDGVTDLTLHDTLSVPDVEHVSPGD